MARSGSGVIHVGGGITTRVPGSVASLQRKHNFYVRIVHVDAPSVSQAFKKKTFLCSHDDSSLFSVFVGSVVARTRASSGVPPTYRIRPRSN